MQVLLLIAGLILLLAVPHLFAGAVTVGIICLVVFGVITLVQLALLAFGVKAAKRAHGEFGRDPFGRR